MSNIPALKITPLFCTVGHKSHDPHLHVFLMEAGFMTFVNHCTPHVHFTTFSNHFLSRWGFIIHILKRTTFLTSVTLDRDEVGQKSINMTDLLKIERFYFVLLWLISLRYKVTEVHKKLERSILFWLLVQPFNRCTNLPSYFLSGKEQVSFMCE